MSGQFRLLEDARHHFLDAALHFEVVCERPGDRNLAGAAGGDALVDQAASVDQEARADALGQAVLNVLRHNDVEVIVPPQRSAARREHWQSADPTAQVHLAGLVRIRWPEGGLQRRD